MVDSRHLTPIAAYRIGLTGAQGTGKSSVVDALVAAMRDAGESHVHAFRGLGGALASAGVVTGLRADASTIQHFVRAHLEREAAATAGVSVFDRVLLDTLAYAMVLDCVPGRDLAKLRNEAVNSSRRFHQLLWLRVAQDYPVESAQDETPVFRRAIDAALGSVAREHAIALQEHALPSARELPAIVADVMARYRVAAPLGRP